MPPLKYTKNCRIFWVPQKYNSQFQLRESMKISESEIHEMAFTAFTGNRFQGVSPGTGKFHVT